MFLRWLQAGVRAAAVVSGIALAAGCSAQSAPIGAGAVTVVRGFWLFCRANAFPDTGAATVPGHGQGVVTLCARWRYKNGVTTLQAVRGSFTPVSGYLTLPSLRFGVYSAPVFGRRPSLVLPLKEVPVHGNHATGADTGWLPAARLAGHGGGSVSLHLRDPYLSMELVAGGAHGARILVGGAGIPLSATGQVS